MNPNGSRGSGMMSTTKVCKIKIVKQLRWSDITASLWSGGEMNVGISQQIN